MMRVSVCLFLSALLGLTLANPYNTNGVCNVNDIGFHGASDPVNGPVTGVTIAGIDITKKYVASRAYTITLTGAGDFHGFLLYATRGTMDLAPTGNAAALAAGSTCGGLAVEHRDNKSKTRVVAVWTAPPTTGLKITFGALMVKNAQFARTTLEIPEVGATTGGEATAAARAGAGATFEFKISVIYDVNKDPAAFAAAFPVDMAAALVMASPSRITVKKATPRSVAIGAETVTDVVFAVSNPQAGTLDDPILTPDEVSNRLKVALATQAQTQTGPLVTSTTMQAVVANSLTLYSGSKGSLPDSGLSGGIIALIIIVVALVVVGAVAAWCYMTRGRRALKSVGGVSSAPMVTSSPKPAAAPVATSDWSKVFDDNTKSYYYFNSRTNESSWTKPPGVNL